MITQKEKEILKDMAKFTATIPHEKFTMLHYCSKTDCGTVGCLLGSYVQHLQKLEGKKPDENSWIYVQWSHENLPSFNSGRLTNLNWDFLFNADWIYANNTPAGAVNRIEYFLKHGVPTDFKYNDPSTYKPFYEV